MRVALLLRVSVVLLVRWLIICTWQSWELLMAVWVVVLIVVLIMYAWRGIWLLIGCSILFELWGFGISVIWFFAVDFATSISWFLLKAVMSFICDIKWFSTCIFWLLSFKLWGKLLLTSKFEWGVFCDYFV